MERPKPTFQQLTQREQRISRVIGQRQALTKTLAKIGEAIITDPNIPDDQLVKSGEEGLKKITLAERVDEHTQGFLEPRLETVRNQKEALKTTLREQASTYAQTIKKAKEQLEKMTTLSRYLTPKAIDIFKKRVAQLESKREEDPDLQSGLALLEEEKAAKETPKKTPYSPREIAIGAPDKEPEMKDTRKPPLLGASGETVMFLSPKKLEKPAPDRELLRKAGFVIENGNLVFGTQKISLKGREEQVLRHMLEHPEASSSNTISQAVFGKTTRQIGLSHILNLLMQKLEKAGLPDLLVRTGKTKTTLYGLKLLAYSTSQAQTAANADTRETARKTDESIDIPASPAVQTPLPQPPHPDSDLSSEPKPHTLNSFEFVILAKYVASLAAKHGRIVIADQTIEDLMRSLSTQEQNIIKALDEAHLEDMGQGVVSMFNQLHETRYFEKHFDTLPEEVQTLFIRLAVEPEWLNGGPTEEKGESIQDERAGTNGHALEYFPPSLLEARRASISAPPVPSRDEIASKRREELARNCQQHSINLDDLVKNYTEVIGNTHRTINPDKFRQLANIGPAYFKETLRKHRLADIKQSATSIEVSTTTAVLAWIFWRLDQANVSYNDKQAKRVLEPMVDRILQEQKKS